MQTKSQKATAENLGLQEAKRFLSEIEISPEDIKRFKKKFDKNRNPYLSCVKHFFGKDFKLSYESTFIPFESFGFAKSFNLRQIFTRYYAWAIPDDHVLKKIASYSPIIEIGAGNGYWASQLARFGADVVAFDIYRGQTERRWFDVKVGNEKAISMHSGRALFLCWPPHKTSMAYECLKKFKGDTVIYVGEFGGCTADDKFHRKLERDFITVETIRLPKWPAMHDYCFIYTRKGKMKAKKPSVEEALIRSLQDACDFEKGKRKLKTKKRYLRKPHGGREK